MVSKGLAAHKTNIERRSFANFLWRSFTHQTKPKVWISIQQDQEFGTTSNHYEFGTTSDNPTKPRVWNYSNLEISTCAPASVKKNKMDAAELGVLAYHRRTVLGSLVEGSGVEEVGLRIGQGHHRAQDQRHDAAASEEALAIASKPAGVLCVCLHT